MARPNQRRRQKIVRQFIDEIELCGITLRRHTLPNGKRVYEEEGVRDLLLAAERLPTPSDAQRFAAFSQPEARH